MSWFSPPSPAATENIEPLPLAGAEALSPYEHILRKGFWTLHFDDVRLEREYRCQVLESGRPLLRWNMCAAIAICLLFTWLDFQQLPEELAVRATWFRLPVMVTCTLLIFGLTFYRGSHARHLPTTFAILTTVAALALCSSQLVSWQAGVERPHSGLLALLMYAQLMGCLPWRVGSLMTLFIFAVLVTAEAQYYTDPQLARVDIIYLFLATLLGIFVGYVDEGMSRLNFLTNGRLSAQGGIDPLTGLANRREMAVLLTRMMRQAAREKVRFTLAMVDIDHFKQFNDCEGHAQGDTILTAIAQALAHPSTAPAPHFIARYGGEEFVTAWFNPKDDATTLGEGLRQAVAALNLPHPGNPLSKAHLSVSVGVADLVPDKDSSVQNLLAAADVALYRAKNGGRDCVREAEPLSAAEAATLPPQPAPVTTTPVTPPPQKRSRLRQLLGLHEQKRLEGTAALTLGILILHIFATAYSIPAPLQSYALTLQLAIALPVCILGYHFSRLPWGLRHAYLLVPLIMMTLGAVYCAILWRARALGVSAPLEIILILACLTYAAGGQSWQAALLSNFILATLFIGTEAAWNALGATTPQLIALFVINLIGLTFCYAQDKLAIDTLQKKELYEAIAVHDPLTGLANRRGLDRFFDTLLALPHSRQQALAVAMIDIDHFKHYNDYYGHAAGDAILAIVAQELASQVHRPYDFVTRYGGEEFLLIWYQPKAIDIVLLGERTRAAILTRNLVHENVPERKITISLGIAYGTLLHGRTSIDALISAADEALYRAKKKRNRVTIAPAVHPPTE